MVAWWTGRGFLSILFLIGVFGAFGALLTFTIGDEALEQWPSLWGVGWVLAAVANWAGGCRLNKRPLNPAKGWTHGRLLYRGARHRFMSLPMEFWSAPALALGVFLIAQGLFFRAAY